MTKFGANVPERARFKGFVAHPAMRFEGAAADFFG
jgi:hypothetical protein